MFIVASFVQKIALGSSFFSSLILLYVYTQANSLENDNKMTPDDLQPFILSLIKHEIVHNW